MARLYALEGWPSASQNNSVRYFDTDAESWNSISASPPFPGTTVDTASVRQAGAYDGRRWYVLSPSGTLYSYDPASNSWSGVLASGQVLVNVQIGGTRPEDTNWMMCSDGLFVYVYQAGEFTRYDPVNNRVNRLTTEPASGTSPNRDKLWMVFDGNDYIYTYRGSDSAYINRYQISNGRWHQLPRHSSMVSNAMGNATFAVCFNNKLYAGYALNGTSGRMFEYDPSLDSWTEKSTTAFTFNLNAKSMWHLDRDDRVRIWSPNNGNASYHYYFYVDTWTSSGGTTPWTVLQGTNFALSRVHNAEFRWYESDMVSQISGACIITSGAIIARDIIKYVKLQTVNTRNTLTVAVSGSYGDGDDAVLISNTLGGTYGKSFTVSSGLTAGSFVDVYIKIRPTYNQSLGIQKLLNLSVSWT